MAEQVTTTTGYRNVYVCSANERSDREGSRRVSPPHASRAHADASAERVYRATGGACLRVDVRLEEVDRGLLVEVA